MAPGADAALLVVDVQNDFLPGGALAVPEGDAVIPLINRIAPRFANVILTQDWHTPDHLSFASQHPGKAPFDMAAMPYGEQVLWPDHCVMGGPGAALHADLSIPHAQLVIRKGHHRGVDSYSAFLEADRRTRTGLDGYLASRNIRHLFIAGLATDFCVAWTAIDARQLGLEATVIEDACRGIDLNGSLARAWRDMEALGVQRIRSDMVG
ncbi:bifunctional nicotinamidase/pyrazinamidase [Roseomonas sp. SSH11]|uniref:nicotinamidase n=1 Tax=Pararoseomonas baculiformis TaxID=2820812 RepID=A0ABS4A877_9PROT|nr:bifunctional nicotinamidase/pyrazinamidase [Pararoseomonas baculiformis]MBP0443205.1 bifunctional nicotinamidase/pyrazinamidase [Pararoseomonas baculiformis]